MKVGDTVKIKGRLGFLMNPTITILEEKGWLVKVIATDRIGDDKGILSHMNESWHSKELLEKQLES